MTIRRTISFSLVFLAFSLCWAQQEKQMLLTLEDCILLAIKNNLQLAVEVYDPEFASLSVNKAKEKFMPSLAFGYTQRNTNSASFSWIDAAELITEDYREYSVGMSQLLPTGGRLSVSLETYKNDTNAKFQTINPRLGSTLTLGFAQPLLKDFGFKASRREILIAQNNQKISENDFKNILLRTICDVEQAYWDLVYSIEILKVKQQSLRLAQDLLEKNQKEVEIGTQAPKEILSAQAEVAARQADILQAGTQVKDYADLLKTLINLPDETGMIDIIPVDKPALVKKEIGLKEAFSTALKSRPDLQSSRVELGTKDLELDFARNDLLPALNLNAGYWSPGISGTRILYQDAISGIVVGKIPGKASDALKDAFHFKYKNWAVYLTLDLPLNTFLSRAAVAQAKVNHEKAAAYLNFLEQQVQLEIKTAVRAVEINYERAEAYRVASDLAQKKLEAEEAKLKAGLTTNFVVLQYQRDLANARSAELGALVDYNLSLSRRERAMGVSLENRNIRLI